MTTKQKTVAINKFLGLNLKNDPMGLKKGEMVKADNIDIDDNFKPRTRKGFENNWAGEAHSLHGNDNLLLFKSGSQLFTYDPIAGFNPKAMRSDMHQTNPCAYVDVGNETYYCDGAKNGKFVGINHTDWKVEEPNGMPALAPATGTMVKGCYHVNITYVHADGRESGCGESSTINLSSTQGITLSDIPQPSPTANIGYINVYCTEPDGLTLWHHRKLDVGTLSHIIGDTRFKDDLMTQFKRPPPVGNYLAYAGSRVWVAVGKYLFASLPFSYHLFDLTKDYFIFDAPINMLAGHVDTGLYVSADKTFFVSTTEENFPRRTISNYKAITGTVCYMDGQELGEAVDDTMPVWVAENGVVLGMAGGAHKKFHRRKNRHRRSGTGCSYRSEGRWHESGSNGCAARNK